MVNAMVRLGLLSCLACSRAPLPVQGREAELGGDTGLGSRADDTPDGIAGDMAAGGDDGGVLVA